MFIFTILCSIIYTVSENRNMGSVGGGGCFGKPAPGLYRSLTVQNMKFCSFLFQIKKSAELESNLDSPGPGQCSIILLISGGQKMTVIGTIFGSCPGTVTSLTVKSTTMPTIMWEPVGGGVGLLYRRICLILVLLTIPIHTQPLLS